MMKIKSKQKLRIVRHFGSEHITVWTTVGKLVDTLDFNTAVAVEEALKTIVDDHFQYKGIGATFRGMSLQVDLID